MSLLLASEPNRKVTLKLQKPKNARKTYTYVFRDLRVNEIINLIAALFTI